jgi:hypothetical protein
VELTRTSDAELTGFVRVQRAEDFAGERVIQIGRSAGGGSWVGHFPGSVGGQALAESLTTLLAEAEKEIGTAYPGEELPPVEFRAHGNYVLQQTSSPAVVLWVADIAGETDEERFLDPAWLHREAYLIYLALADDLRAPPDPADLDAEADSLVTLEIQFLDGESPAFGVAVQLDGMLLVTGLDGVVRFGKLDPSVHHLLTVSWGENGGAMEAWIHPQRGRVWRWEKRANKPEAVGPES